MIALQLGHAVRASNEAGKTVRTRSCGSSGCGWCAWGAPARGAVLRPRDWCACRSVFPSQRGLHPAVHPVFPLLTAAIAEGSQTRESRGSFAEALEASKMKKMRGAIWGGEGVERVATDDVQVARERLRRVSPVCVHSFIWKIGAVAHEGRAHLRSAKERLRRSTRAARTLLLLCLLVSGE